MNRTSPLLNSLNVSRIVPEWHFPRTENSLYMNILMSNSVLPDSTISDRYSAVDITSEQSVEQFYATVMKLTELIPWKDYDTVKIAKNMDRLECTITLVETDVCEIILKFKKIDNDNFDKLRFFMHDTFQPDIDSAAYWLKCMLT